MIVMGLSIMAEAPMRNRYALAISALVAAGGLSDRAMAQDICQGYGPQTPRDIRSTAGSNARVFTLAPSTIVMNLCNIHFHSQAEHKAPGFSVFAGDGEHGGYRCNEAMVPVMA
jgi:hypothetical protein